MFWIELLKEEFEEYYEQVYNELTEEFFISAQYWIENSEVYNRWVTKLHDGGVKSADAAIVIERAYKVYYGNIRLQGGMSLSL